MAMAKWKFVVVIVIVGVVVGDMSVLLLEFDGWARKSERRRIWDVEGSEGEKYPID
jgi:hypothetical protein